MQKLLLLLLSTFILNGCVSYQPTPNYCKNNAQKLTFRMYLALSSTEIDTIEDITTVGESIIFEDDVQSVKVIEDYAGEQSLAITVTTSAGGKLHKLASDHIGKKIAMKIDNKVIYVSTISMPIASSFVTSGITDSQLENLYSKLKYLNCHN